MIAEPNASDHRVRFVFSKAAMLAEYSIMANRDVSNNGSNFRNGSVRNFIRYMPITDVSSRTFLPDNLIQFKIVTCSNVNLLLFRRFFLTSHSCLHNELAWLGRWTSVWFFANCFLRKKESGTYRENGKCRTYLFSFRKNRGGCPSHQVHLTWNRIMNEWASSARFSLKGGFRSAANAEMRTGMFTIAGNLVNKRFFLGVYKVPTIWMN